MNLGEKIYKLRKEKNLSQEALAERVGTTRQAISKWENNQGYPETEKLLLLSNVFAVSVDFLLKDEKTENTPDEKGYYVSREMAVGYLANEKKTCKYCGMGLALLSLSGIPYVVFRTMTTWKVLGMSICILAGVIALVTSVFIPKDEYKVLRKEPLIFDYDFLKGLTKEYLSQKKKYVMMAIANTVLYITGLLVLMFTVRGSILWKDYHAFAFLALAVGIFGMVLSSGTMEAYEVLVHNDSYSNRFWFKLRRKVQSKIDRW